MKRTAVTRDGDVIRRGAWDAEEGRPGAVWRDLFFHKVDPDFIDTLALLRSKACRNPGGHSTVCAALGLAEDADEAARFTLNYFGLTAAHIVREGHCWRLPMSKERGLDALVLPVGGRGLPAFVAQCLALLGAHDWARECDSREIGDLIAIPLDGSAPLSFNRSTAAVGAFSVTVDGRMRLATSGLRWLKSHVKRARKTKLEPYEVPRSLNFPDRFETLLLDAGAFSWRREADGWLARSGAREVVCPDSAVVTEFIAAELERREKLPAAPKVIGPRS